MMSFTYGRKGVDGKKPTQWVEGALWGKRAEALVEYLSKGSLLVVTLDEVHIETFDGKNGPGHKLAGKVIDIELVPSGQSSSSAPAPASRPAPSPAPARSAPRSSFADMDDDIPF